MNLGTGIKIIGNIGLVAIFFGAVHVVNRNRTTLDHSSKGGEFRVPVWSSLAYRVPAKAFQFLSVDGPFRVKVSRGSHLPVKVAFHPEASRLIQFEHSESALRVKWKGAATRSKLIDIEVSAPNLAQIRVNGRSVLQMDRSDFPTLRVIGEGYSKIDIGESRNTLLVELTGYAQLKTHCQQSVNLDLKIQDSAAATISGFTQNLTAKLDGNAQLKTESTPLSVGKANVQTFADSRARLKQIDRLDSWAFGRSCIAVDSDPSALTCRAYEDGVFVVKGEPKVWAHDSKLRATSKSVAQSVAEKVNRTLNPLLTAHDGKPVSRTMAGKVGRAG